MAEFGEMQGITNLSRINEAGNQVLRIGGLWGEANTAAANGDFQRWNSKLERVWSELCADADEEHRDKFEEMNKEIKKLKIYASFANMPKSKRPDFLDKLKNLQYQKLMEKDLFLRELQNLQGKGTLYRDEYEDDFE